MAQGTCANCGAEYMILFADGLCVFCSQPSEREDDLPEDFEDFLNTRGYESWDYEKERNL